MPSPIIFAVSVFLFILSMIGVQQCFFARHWRRFFLILACAIISGSIMSVQMYEWMVPVPERDLPLVIRQPTTPL